MVLRQDGTYMCDIIGDEHFGETVHPGVMRVYPGEPKPHRNYYAYLTGVFYREMKRVSMLKADTDEENEALNERFWKLSEREMYYLEKWVND